MFDICLFDLDQTLVNTQDMKTLREAGKDDESPDYIEKVIRAFDAKPTRTLYSKSLLEKIRSANPKLKLGVFTRAPRSYALAILSKAYPGFPWDIVVAYEDVKRRKPYGDGIDHAIEKLESNILNRIMLIGDSDVDIRAAYHAGCVAVLDVSSWPSNREHEHWRALDLIPDVVLKDKNALLDVLKGYEKRLPELEKYLSGVGKTPGGNRFEKMNKFIPKAAGGDKAAYPVYYAGRLFSNYSSIKYRKKWHRLTKSIIDHKKATTFPNEWVLVVREFIKSEYGLLGLMTSYSKKKAKLVVAVVPHRPERPARLEAFLKQVEASHLADPILHNTEIEFCTDLLAYTAGVKSNSNDKLNQVERFENVKKHLVVSNTVVASGAKNILVIDDVCTSGSTLIYSKKQLKIAGAENVTCFALAMNIGDVLYAVKE